jgi:sialic acid synthase SpsE
VEEAIEAVRAGGSDQICLLQCASAYPAPPELMNLRSMATMRASFGVPVGLSDHTLGVHVSVAAVALGASIIEKHYTLDRSLPGPDHPFAIEPDELAMLVSQSRDIEAAMGDGRKRGPSALESEEMFSKARRSLVAVHTIPAGTTIERGMLTVKRPGHGIKPRFLDAVVGRQAAIDIEEDEVITWEMV